MDEIVIHALGVDGVTTWRAGGGQQCQHAGAFTTHSYPVEGSDGDPCQCGETKRGDPVEDESDI